MWDWFYGVRKFFRDFYYEPLREKDIVIPYKMIKYTHHPGNKNLIIKQPSKSGYKGGNRKWVNM